LIPTPPTISVALPTCDGARHLREALSGLRLQGEVPFDLIVSDDRSTDDTLAIIGEEFSDRARISVNSERLGLAGNWNRCVALSRTPLVAVFHQDDLMRPGHLAAHLAAFAARPDLGLIASATDVIDHAGREVPRSIVGRGGLGPTDRVFDAGQSTPELAVENPLRCSGATIAASAHAAVGGFDPSYRYVVDWDFWLKVGRVRPVAWLARPTVAIRWHLASETHRFKTGLADLEETSRLLDDLARRDGPTLSNSRQLRRKADRRLARAYLNRAHDALKGGDAHLARIALGRAWLLSPRVVATCALDPRLLAQMATLAASRGLERFSGWSSAPTRDRI